MTPHEIRLMRKRFFMSQDDLAARMGVARDVISKWELGKNKPNKGNSEKLCKLNTQLSRARAARIRTLCAGLQDYIDLC